MCSHNVFFSEQCKLRLWVTVMWGGNLSTMTCKNVDSGRGCSCEREGACRVIFPLESTNPLPTGLLESGPPSCLPCDKGHHQTQAPSLTFSLASCLSPLKESVGMSAALLGSSGQCLVDVVPDLCPTQPSGWT